MRLLTADTGGYPFSHLMNGFKIETLDQILARNRVTKFARWHFASGHASRGD
jgi:hypothetical protein